MIELIISNILIVAFCYITMSATWTFYLAIMSIKKEHLKLKEQGKDFTWPQKIFIYPMLFLGFGIDVFLNATVGTIIFLELPRYDIKEVLFTGRVSRWNDDKGWKGATARYFCKTFLDPFDIGGHCA